ncbi:hypothetical protein CWI38_2255p0010 [Hamiltosporidium tvaerminnensis]|uniref:Uncharacterized protein n=1 Tax=Hamiltosporidium tvaerminnensis TaxID=1176355 RepID=A0A4Q9LKF5_9MICR|nr:hypothetical protein CWI38_2255p0010 [Hamiltosporidium tvaerminnensis]
MKEQIQSPPLQTQQPPTPTDYKPTEIKPTRSRAGLIFKLVGIFVALLAIAFCAAKYYFAFVDIDEYCYADYFYTWRVKYADSALFEKVYRFVQKNSYYEKEDEGKVHKFVQYAQEGDRMLFDGYPEHSPRGDFKRYYTLNFKGNEKYLKFRKSMVNADGNAITDSELLEGKKEVGKKDIHYFDDKVTKEKDVDIKKILTKDEHKEIFTFLKDNLFPFLQKCRKGDFKEKIGKKIPDEIVQEVKKLAEAGVKLGGDDVSITDDHVKKFIGGMGVIKLDAMECFIYSRIVYITLLSVADILGDLKVDSKLTSKQKDALPKYKHLLNGSRSIARMLTGMYEHPLGSSQDTKDVNGFRKFCRRRLGLKPATLVSEDEENMDLILKKLEERIQ